MIPNFVKATLLTAIFLTCCQTIPEADAPAVCREVFSELKRKTEACGGTYAGDPGCDNAYSYDEGELQRCKEGLAAYTCPELDKDHFLAVCGKVFYLKTW